MKNLVLVVALLWSANSFTKQIIDFELPMYGSNEKMKLSSLVKKNKVVINFWASWCTACIAELEELEKLKKKNPEIVFVAINAGESKKKIKRFLKKHDFSYSHLIDQSMSYAKSIGVLELPQTFIIGPNLKILYRGHRPPKEI